MARSTGTRKILSGNSLFFLIRTLGRHLEKESHFMACYRRDIYLWTELGQELCCLHLCTSRAGQRPSPVTSNYLRPVVYMFSTLPLSAFLQSILWKKPLQISLYLCVKVFCVEPALLAEDLMSDKIQSCLVSLKSTWKHNFSINAYSFKD